MALSSQVFDPPFAASLDHQVRNLSPVPPVVNDQASASDTAMLAFGGIADHARTCRWLNPVANDPVLPRTRVNAGTARPHPFSIFAFFVFRVLFSTMPRR